MGKCSVRQVLLLAALLAGSTPSAFATLVVTPTFTANFNTNFGANAAAAQAAWISAASIFSSFFTDNIHVNITVDAVAGTSVFGQSSTSLFATSYANMRTLLLADSKTVDDATALGVGGSVAAADPIGGTHTWWVSRAQAKALGLIADDGFSDGSTTFGAGHAFTFSGAIAPGTYDFQGIVAHELTEVMGRLGICGGAIGGFTNSYSLMDIYSYTGAGVRSPGNGPGSFSIDNGTTLLKTFNDASVNGFDCRDWAPGTNDAFNQFSNPGVVNAVSALDLRVMDVIGYDFADPVPEPATLSLVTIGFSIFVAAKKLRSRTFETGTKAVV